MMKKQDNANKMVSEMKPGARKPDKVSNTVFVSPYPRLFLIKGLKTMAMASRPWPSFPPS